MLMDLVIGMRLSIHSVIGMRLSIHSVIGMRLSIHSVIGMRLSIHSVIGMRLSIHSVIGVDLRRAWRGFLAQTQRRKYADSKHSQEKDHHRLAPWWTLKHRAQPSRQPAEQEPA